MTTQLVLLATLGLFGCAADGEPGNPDAGDGGEVPPFTDGVSMLSGDSEPGFVDGPRGTARFANPVNVALGPDGMLYVADFDNGKLRVVDPTDGETTTLIDQPNFRRPFGMAFAPDRTLYVSTDEDAAGARDAMAGTIWRVDLDAGTAVVVASRIGKPRGIAVLPDGRLALSDYQHHVVQLLDPSTGSITPLAGTWGVKGTFSAPYGIAALGVSLVVADFDNHRLRIVGLDGSVETLAGSGVAGFADGALGAAQFDHPQGVAVTASGDVYITDLGNYRIRRIQGSAVGTVAGVGRGGYIDSDDLLAAELYGIEGLSVEPAGAMLYVADGGRGEAVPYNRIRSIKMN
jgi:DNA-binding beta-propeller fold protein YncE